MNVETAAPPSRLKGVQVRQALADCDIHPAPRSIQQDLYPFMDRRWREHIDVYGIRHKTGLLKGSYPKIQPNAARRDAFPPGGGGPGSDLAFMRAQHLDPNNVQIGVLFPLQGQGVQNLDLCAALCTALNEWQVAAWTSQEPRLRGTLLVPYENAPAAVREIERAASNRAFVQVGMHSRTAEPMGQRRYWPIYEAAAAAGLPVGVHAFGFSGWPLTSGGWGSFYIEDMNAHAQNCATLLISMVMEGVFERVPKLRLVLVESGFSWLPALCWRLDTIWEKLRDETPVVKRRPSEYIREHVWLTSQPIEEPDDRSQLGDVIDWIGWDRLLYSSDYPHWDFDDPSHALPLRVDAGRRQRFFRDNALSVYGIAS